MQYLYWILEYKCMSHVYIYSICIYTVLDFIVPFEYFYCKKKTVVLKLLKINVFLYIKATYLADIFLFGQFSLLLSVNCSWTNSTWPDKTNKKQIAYNTDIYVLLMHLQVGCGLAELSWDGPISPELVQMQASVRSRSSSCVVIFWDQKLPMAWHFMVDYRIPSEASRILSASKALAQNGHSLYHHLHSVV